MSDTIMMCCDNVDCALCKNWVCLAKEVRIDRDGQCANIIPKAVIRAGYGAVLELVKGEDR